MTATQEVSTPTGPANAPARPGPARAGLPAWLVRSRPGTIVLLLVLAYLIVPPLVVMVWKSLVAGPSLSGPLGFGAYHDIAGSGLGTAVVQTLEFAVGTTVVSMVLGTAMAWAVGRTDAPARGLAYAVAFLGLGVPGIVNVIGWILLFGNGNGQGDTILSGWFGHQIHIGVESMTGMIFVESLLSIPIVFFVMVGPMRSMNVSLEEAAAIHGARSRTVSLRISLPLLVPAVASAALLVLIRSVQAFEVPVLLGTPAGAHILTADLYRELHGSLIPDYSGAAAYGMCLVVVLLLLVGLESRATRDARRFAVVGGRGGAGNRTRLGRWRWAPLVLYVVLLLCYLLPTVYLLYASFERNLSGGLSLSGLTTSNYSAMFNAPDFGKSVTDTLEVAALTAVLATGISLAAAWVSVRRRRIGTVVNLAANLPIVVPGIVLGFGILLFYLYSPVPLFGTIWAIVLGFVALYLPYGMRTVRPAVVGIAAELEEAGRISGASERQIAGRIVFPLVRPSAAGAAMFVFFNAFRELAVAALVVTAATPLLSTQLLDAIVNGDLNVVSALGTFIMAVSLVVGAVGFRLITLGGRRGAGIGAGFGAR
jgi:iron(III) transport system permease protein